MKTKRPTQIRAMADEVLRTEFLNKNQLRSIQKKFYAIMKRHGIKQGEWSGNGRRVANAEWTAAVLLLRNTIDTQIMWSLMTREPPDELLAYGAKQKPKEEADEAVVGYVNDSN